MWSETGKPDLAVARAFAGASPATHPGRLRACNGSRSLNWKPHLDDATIDWFQRELAAGDRFQFTPLAGFHALNHSMLQLAHGCARR